MAVTTSRAGDAEEPDGGTVGEPGDGDALRTAAEAEALLLEVVRGHADELLAVARRHSLCADDAHDAYQRALEQFLRHGRRLRGETAMAWLFTVCKREAQAVRRARGQLVGADAFDADRLEARHDASPEDRAVAAEAVRRGAEALQALRPQELRALWLRADGHSYAEIQAVTGWSYTKVNRCLTEGRRRFLARCAALEAGTECERWHPALAAVAAGEAGAAELTALRPHLRGCAACRATLRGLHASGASIATVLPPGLLGVGALEVQHGPGGPAGLGGLLARTWEAATEPLQERATLGALKWQAAVEAATSGKVAAVAASTVALAGGGAVVAGDVSRPGQGTPVQAAHAAAAPRPAPAAVRRVMFRSADPRAASAGPLGTSARVGQPVDAQAPSPRRVRAGSATYAPSRGEFDIAPAAPAVPAASPEFDLPTSPAPADPAPAESAQAPAPAIRGSAARAAAPVPAGEFAP